MQPKMPESCAAVNCTPCAEQSGVAFFRFPQDPVRCKQWLDNCRRPDLEQKTPEQLHKLYKLCARHFEPSLICTNSTLRTVLRQDAVPTIFDFTSHLTNPQNCNRKRIRDVEEVLIVKKPKDDGSCTPPEEMGENSAACELEHDACREEEPSFSKAKETLKLYFKETLAFTGFSIRSNANTGESLESHAGLSRLNSVCGDKIDQKEVLQVGEECMLDEIRNSLRSARFFSVLLEDVASIDGKDLIPVFIRSVTVAGFPQKHLMGFLPSEVDAETLAYMLLSAVRNKWGLRMEHCRGLTYLTSGCISQKMKDVASRILRDFPQVVLTPSDPYAFNVWLIRCMPIESIQKVVNTVEEVAALLRTSSVLQKKLDEEIVRVYGHVKGEVDRIREARQVHWEYGADAFQTMLDLLEPFIRCVTREVNDKEDMENAERIVKLKLVLNDFNFIITLVVLKNTLCCVSILNPSLKGTISISSTLQFTISNALKLLSKQMQEIAICHRKWFTEACTRAKKLGVEVTLPENSEKPPEGEEQKLQTSLEDFYRAEVSTQILQYLIQEVKQVFSSEMVRILRWLTLVPSYMADHNFSIRRDKVADANLNNLARPDSFYDELGCWEVKWKHASKRRILPTTVFGTLKIPDIEFYPNVQSLLKVLGTIPCVNVEADVYGQYDMVLERYHSYLRATLPQERHSNMTFVFVNQDVHFSVEDMVDVYVEKHPGILKLLHTEEEPAEPQLTVAEDNEKCVLKEEVDEPEIMAVVVQGESTELSGSAEEDQETLKSALKSVVKMVCGSQSTQGSEVGAEPEKEEVLNCVPKSQMKEILAACEDVMREGILMEVGNSYFSLFIDRVVTFGEKDYLPLFLRFVDNFDIMRLELMCFVDADLDSGTLFDRLYSTIVDKWRLDWTYCRGQAYLGSGKVAWKLKAFASKILETYPLAICTHCSCYSFNIWWSKSIPVPAICRALDTVEEIILFFSSSPILEKQLDQVIALGLRESYEKVQELQGTFCAQWLEKHDTYEVLVQMLEALVECLEKIRIDKQQRWKSTVSEQAGRLLGTIRDFDFIVSMVALKNVSSFTKELSAGLQKDHFTAATQLCQINGILSTLNRVKTAIKVFHQNWFDEACTLALSLSVQIKVPEGASVSRDTMVKPVAYYKDTLSMPLVDSLINAVKEYFSDEHKEALNFLSLVPCSMTVSYMFEILKSKDPLYINDLPEPDNFFTELCCWRVKWKTRVTSIKIPDTIFHTLRLPDIRYFGNVNTLLRIMCVLPSTAMEYGGEARRHKMFQDYLRASSNKERSPSMAMLQVGSNLTRDLDRMVDRCVKITSKTPEARTMDKELKPVVKDEFDMEVNCPPVKIEECKVEDEPAITEQSLAVTDENGHAGEDRQSLEIFFKKATELGRMNCRVPDLSTEDQQALLQNLRNACDWTAGVDHNSSDISLEEVLEMLVRSIRQDILLEIQESPFFSLITDNLYEIAGKKYLPTFIRYVVDGAPKVELIGFLPYDDDNDDVLAESLHAVLAEDWGLQMEYCRAQAFMRFGAEGLSLKNVSSDFLRRYPLAIHTPCSSQGLVFFLAGCLPCASVSKVVNTMEQVLLFFDKSQKLRGELAQVTESLVSRSIEYEAVLSESSCLKWIVTEEIFDLLVDLFEGLLKCLDAVSSNADGSWSNSISLHAGIFSQAMRDPGFVITLVYLKKAFLPMKGFCQVFRSGTSAELISEIARMPSQTALLSNSLDNIDSIHPVWFAEAVQLAVKVSTGHVRFPQESFSFESPERYYCKTLGVPILTSLLGELQFFYSDTHLDALKCLSLIPSCHPDVTEEFDIPIIHHIDLPEPDTLQQDLNNWVGLWKGKSMEGALPASVPNTLLHPEAKSLPNVCTLLKVLAVLPSVRMDTLSSKDGWDLMRARLRAAVGTGNSPDLLMLRMQSNMVRTLEEMIDLYIEVEPEKRTLLRQVKIQLENLKEENGDVLEAMDDGCPPGAEDLEVSLYNKVDQYPEETQGADGSAVEQRGIMTFYGPSVREEILKDLWDSQFFTVITEQVMHVEGHPYVPLCVRYMDKLDNHYEETLALIPSYSDPNVLADVIETTLSEKWGLNMEYCRGQAYLSSGLAGTQMKAASSIISEKYPLALRTACSSVSLNVWLARSSPVLDISRSVATIEKMFSWFIRTPLLQTMLEDAIALKFQQDGEKEQELREKLTGEWHKYHDAPEAVVDLLKAVIHCLAEVIHKKPNETLSLEAQLFYSKVRDFDFVFTIVVLKNLTSLTQNLSQSLLGNPSDVLLAVKRLPAVLDSLNEVKQNIAAHHETWYKEALVLAMQLQIKVLHPVLQGPLSNHYKNVVSIKAIEHVITEITELFSDRVLRALKCLILVPYVMSSEDFICKEGDVTGVYREDLPDADCLASELKMWEERWKSTVVEHLPATTLDSLKVTDIRCYCNIETLLRVLVVFPLLRTQSSFREGRISLQEYMLMRERSFTQLFPL
ncbi:uncharacterized protein LOC136746773 [Amia ocellicauda]|uniref:uncharacterized protein LOC136746773 n=1 Tax=Amia ocellicauda TaxID=2972642 RepID=UPI0034643ECA